MKKTTIFSLPHLLRRAVITTAAVLFTASIAQAQFSGAGAGTEASPYIITTAEQLNEVRNYLGADHADKHFKLGADINLGVAPWNVDEGWVPIGQWGSTFNGSLTNPDGHIISGLTINRPGTNDRVGLFGHVGSCSGGTCSGTVSGLLLENVSIVGNAYVGAVAGGRTGSSSGTMIENCVVTGTIIGNDQYVGGVVGGNGGGTVRNNTVLLASISNTGTPTGRVAGLNNGTLTNNRAWSGMTVIDNGDPKEPLANTLNGGIDGADMTAAQAAALLENLGMTVPDYIGNGSAEKPFLIYTAADLNNIRNGLDKHYVLAADIDLTAATGTSGGAYWNDGAGWVPIGGMATQFTGSLTNPDGHIIKGLTIDRSTYAYVGLFGYVGNGGKVNGLLLENVSIVGQYRVGAVAGENGGTVENCVVTGTVSGSNIVSGVAGYNDVGTVSDNVALLGSVSISTGTSVGRVVGWTPSSGILTANRAWSGMTVTIDSEPKDPLDNTANGMDGANLSTAAALRLLDSVGMSAPDYLKGNGSATNPFAIIDAAGLNGIRHNLSAHYRLEDDIDLSEFIEGTWGDDGWLPIGDFFNRFTGSLTNSDGYIISGLRIDRQISDLVGLFGYVGITGEISGVLLENVDIEGRNYVGAVAGGTFNGGTVKNCVVTGTVSGNERVSGVVGNNEATGTVSGNVALLGSVSGSNDVGRVVGLNINDLGTLDNNEAWSGLLVNGELIEDGEADNINGADMSTVEAIDLLEGKGMVVPQYLLDAKAAEDAAEAAAAFREAYADILSKTVATVAISDKPAVEAVREAYNALTEGAQALLENELALLVALEGRIKELEDEANVGTSVAGTAAAQALKLYPNPITTGELSVKNEAWSSNQPITIYTLSGALVATHPATGEVTTINVGHLPTGTYVLKVGRHTTKFVK